MTKNLIPARLDIFIARKSPKALILRKGPTKQVCTIGWDLKTDEFTIGQWFKGRIYEWFCDFLRTGNFSSISRLRAGALDSKVKRFGHGLLFPKHRTLRRSASGRTDLSEGDCFARIEAAG